MTHGYMRSGTRTGVLVASLLAGPLLGAASAVSVPGNYPTIQSAINAVLNGTLPDGTTIDVQAGTYFEALFIANSAKSFTVRGVGAAGSVIVDATGQNTAALTVLQATGLMVFKGLVFRHGSNSAGGGFLIQQSSPTLTNAAIDASGATEALGATSASRWMPAGAWCAGANSSTALANAR